MNRASDLERLVAHELGHGIFTLHHTFDENYGGSSSIATTDNLMDYAGGEHLAAFQWNTFANPAPITALDSDDDSKLFQTYDEESIERFFNRFRYYLKNGGSFNFPASVNQIYQGEVEIYDEDIQIRIMFNDILINFTPKKSSTYKLERFPSGEDWMTFEDFYIYVEPNHRDRVFKYMQDISEDIYLSDFTIIDIPNVMKDKLGWNMSAEIMNKWFSLPAKTMTESEKNAEKIMCDYPLRYVDSTTYVWNDIIEIDIFADSLNALIAILQSPRAMELVQSKIAQHHKGKATNGTITTYNSSILNLHYDWHFQTREVDLSYFKNPDLLTDLDGGLGKYCIHAAIVEYVVITENNENICIIDKVGLYMKDTYDFIGFQLLGMWDFDKVSRNSENYVSNSSFNDFREVYNKGGDLYVFSDIYIFTLDKPIRIKL